MSRKLAIVTGANCGIGFRAAELLCQAGVEVILACRSEAKGVEAVGRIKAANADANASFMKLDLADLSSVKTFSDQFLAMKKPLNILVNNAGLYNRVGLREETKDGFELHMGTNHLGHFLLTNLLLETLKISGTSEEKSCVVLVASMRHNGASKEHRTPVKDIDFDDLHLKKEDAYFGPQAYKNSKAANVMFALRLARLVQKENVVVNCMCPGFIPATDLGRSVNPIQRFMMRWVLDGLLKPIFNITRTIDHGAGLIVELAIDQKHAGETGQYYSDYKAVSPSTEASDQERQDKLWQVSKSEIMNKITDVTIVD